MRNRVQLFDLLALGRDLIISFLPPSFPPFPSPFLLPPSFIPSVSLNAQSFSMDAISLSTIIEHDIPRAVLGSAITAQQRG